MQVLSPVDPLIRDEHILAIDPAPRAVVAEGEWRRRVHPVVGRSLSHKALSLAQEMTGQIQRRLAQSVSPGLVRGLEVTLRRVNGQDRLTVTPGLALTHGGEDVEVARMLDVPVLDLAVCLRAQTLRTWQAASSGISQAAADALSFAAVPLRPINGAPELSGYAPRAMGPRLGALITPNVAADLPRVAVLVAEPVTLDAVVPGEQNARYEAFAGDVRDEPFEDRRLIDGVRLVLYLWPDEIRAVAGANAPDYALPDAMRPDFRNRLAHALFSVERGFEPGDAHPWEQLGVPLALVHFAPDWRVDFIDCAAVTRIGGKPRPRTSMVKQAGTPQLWQARISQLVEQVMGGDLSSPGIASLRDRLPRLPPVGLLPREVLDTQTFQQTFFPATFGISYIPVSLEQMELVVRESASLRPLALDQPEMIEVLLPVPERLYDPELLKSGTLDMALSAGVKKLAPVRDRWLAHRAAARTSYGLLATALSGQQSTWPARDADEQDGEHTAPFGMERYRSLTGSIRHSFSFPAERKLTLQPLDRVFLWVRAEVAVSSLTLQLPEGRLTWSRAAGAAQSLPNNAGWIRLEAKAADVVVPLQSVSVSSGATKIEFQQVGGRVDWGPMGVINATGSQLIWVGDDPPSGATVLGDGDIPLQSIWQPAFEASGDGPAIDQGQFGAPRTGPAGQRQIEALSAFKKALNGFSFLARNMPDVEAAGLDVFIERTEASTNRINDLVDKGFLRCRADTFRIRQMMLGEADASRLATSPALSEIVKRGDGSFAINEKLLKYIESARAALKTAPEGANAPTPTPSGNNELGAQINMRPMELRIARTNGVAVSDAIPRMAPLNTQFSLGSPAAVVSGLQPAAQREGATIPVAPQDALSLPFSRARSELLTRQISNRSFILEQSPMLNYIERTVTVAQRLVDPEAVTARSFALKAREQLVQDLFDAPDSFIKVNDIAIPGAVKAGSTLYIISELGTATADPLRKLLTEGAPLSGSHEAAYYNSAIQIIDDTVALLRLVEARLAQYRQIVSHAREARGIMAGFLKQAEAALAIADGELSEARHDISVGQALVAEDARRVAEVDARRRDILTNHIPFLLFRRQRWLDHGQDMSTASVIASAEARPVQICLDDHHEAPVELREMADGFRQAPAQWFPALRKAATLLDRMAPLKGALNALKIPLVQPKPQTAPASGAGDGRILTAVRRSLTIQNESLQMRQVGRNIPSAVLADTLGLQAARLRYVESATLADLMGSGHATPEISRRTSEVVQKLGQLGGCLHASFADVPASLRLEWAQMLSAFDQPIALNQLNVLPGWQGLAADMRRTQQQLVEALHQLIDPAVPEAVGAVNELIRVAILLAAHAPVAQLIGARVTRPVRPVPGHVLELQLDLTRVRMGMDVMVKAPSGTVIARAVVADIIGGLAQARITSVEQLNVQITTETMIHVAEALRPAAQMPSLKWVRR
jgi:hypothetical protein